MVTVQASSLRGINGIMHVLKQKLVLAVMINETKFKRAKA